MKQSSLPNTSRQLRVFLCHSTIDKPVVRELYRRLKNSNVKPWLDEENLLGGQYWEQEIEKAIKVSDAVIVCLSQGSITKAGFFHRELKHVLNVANEQPQGDVFLIPLRLQECQVPTGFEHLHWIDFFQERGFERLVQTLEARAEKLGTLLPIKEAKTIEEPPLEKEIKRIPGPLKAKTKLFELPKNIKPRTFVLTGLLLTTLVLISFIIFVSNKVTPPLVAGDLAASNEKANSPQKVTSRAVGNLISEIKDSLSSSLLTTVPNSTNSVTATTIIPTFKFTPAITYTATASVITQAPGTPTVIDALVTPSTPYTVESSPTITIHASPTNTPTIVSINTPTIMPISTITPNSLTATAQAVNSLTNLLRSRASKVNLAPSTNGNIAPYTNSSQNWQISVAHPIINPYVKNFIVEATFYNPSNATSNKWSYGFIFRSTDAYNSYRLYITSEGNWSFEFIKSGVDGEESYLVKNAKLNTFDPLINKNKLSLYVLDKFAFFYLNENYIGSLDVSGKLDAGNVVAAAGLRYGEQLTETTRYEDYVIYSLD